MFSVTLCFNMLNDQSDGKFRHGSLPLLVVCACSLVSPIGSCQMSFVLKGELCDPEKPAFFRH